MPPRILHELPRTARIKCPKESWRTRVFVWEHAERPPYDESSSIWDRGAELGAVKHCEPVEVLDYEWSAFRDEFWLLVEDHHRNRGWLPAQFVVFGPWT